MHFKAFKFPLFLDPFAGILQFVSEHLTRGLINQCCWAKGLLGLLGFGGSATVIKGMKYIMVTNLPHQTIEGFKLVELIFFFFP